MALETILVPDIGDDAAVEIVEILVAVGDTGAVDDALITLARGADQWRIADIDILEEQRVVAGQR